MKKKQVCDMQYRIEDIMEADFGCEERQEGQTLMCCLALSKTGEGNLSESETGSASDSESAARSGSAADKADRLANEKIIYRNMPDTLADELYLVKGQILSEDELNDLEAGKKPEGWDDLNHRNTYETDIGLVCMSSSEYREYREKKEEMEYARQNRTGGQRPRICL